MNSHHNSSLSHNTPGSYVGYKTITIQHFYSIQNHYNLAAALVTKACNINQLQTGIHTDYKIVTPCKSP